MWFQADWQSMSLGLWWRTYGEKLLHLVGMMVHHVHVWLLIEEAWGGRLVAKGWLELRLLLERDCLLAAVLLMI